MSKNKSEVTVRNVINYIMSRMTSLRSWAVFDVIDVGLSLMKIESSKTHLIVIKCTFTQHNRTAIELKWIYSLTNMENLHTTKNLH